MTFGQFLVIIFGALVGGFVSGFAGFGTGLTATGIWLTVLSPQHTVTLVLICSVVSQAQTLPSIWHAIELRRVLPFVLPGLIGVPIGTWLLTIVDPRAFKIGIGLVLIAFSATMLFRSRTMASSWGGRLADGAVGLAGGIMGGLAGLSGVLPIMWAGIRGWPKDERRAVFQAFNLSILASALIAHVASGMVTVDSLWAMLAALPGTLVGAWLGAKAYARASDERFHKLVLVLLLASGVLLIAGNM